MVESHGDYRNETFLEPLNTPLYRYQNKIPRLPVPSLEETIRRFLPTALPLAETPSEAESLQTAAQDSLVQARTLQERLLQREDKLSDTSWLQEWWDTLGSLQFRDPIVVYMWYVFQLDNDPGATPGVTRGAAVLRAAAEYCKLVISGELKKYRIGEKKTPLCSVAYKYMFHSCHIPRQEQDSYRIYAPRSQAIVACQNQFFVIQVLDESDEILSLLILNQHLNECQEQVKQRVHPNGIAASDISSVW